MWNDVVPLDLYDIRASTTLPGRPAQYATIPNFLHPRIREYLKREFSQLYTHQAKGIEACLRGRDVCLATSTASGKSLVFMAAAVDTLIREPNPKVLVLYPAKALIIDQLKHWKRWGG
jgi:DEAD/DEAH box helicase domain-containing protein